jgi:tight adherence protein C
MGFNLIIPAIITGILIFFLPLVLVLKKIKTIANAVEEELPEIADLLSSLVGAGLTIDESIYYIAKNYRGHISFLFNYARNMVLDGESLKDSLITVSRMSFCNEFKTLINTILQAEAVGNPISKVLKNMAKTIRSRQRDTIKMRAEKLESNLMIVVFIFLFLPMIALFLLPVIPQLQILF